MALQAMNETLGHGNQLLDRLKNRNPWKKRLREDYGNFKSRKGMKGSSSAESADHAGRRIICWPYYLLQEDCPRSRILTWGYSSVVSNFFHGPANKQHIFVHSRDLLIDLKRSRHASVRNEHSFPFDFL